MSYRTPLSNVRGLGTANEGSEHFWRQRVTGFANLILAIFLTYAVFNLAHTDQQGVKTFFADPFNLVLGVALVISVTYHMRLGMQVIIEDYVHKDAAKILLLILNTFYTSFIALAGLLSLLKLSFGA